MNRVQVLATLHAARVALLDALDLLLDAERHAELLGHDDLACFEAARGARMVVDVIYDIDRVLKLDEVAQ